MFGFIQKKWHIYYAIPSDLEYNLDKLIITSPYIDYTYDEIDKQQNTLYDNQEYILDHDKYAFVDTFSLYTMLENCSMYSLFEEPVKICTGRRVKKIFYKEITSAKPIETNHKNTNLAFMQIKPINYYEASKYGWSAKKSANGFHILKNKSLAVRNNTINCTYALYGSKGFNNGIHHWLIRWDPYEYGMHPIIGVGIKGINPYKEGYEPIVGVDQSFGWHLNKLCLLHDIYNKPNEPFKAYPGSEFLDLNGKFNTPYEISVILDMKAGTLGFMVDWKFLGVAFKGLKGKKLYPMVSTTWGNAIIEIKHVGSYFP